MLSLIILSIDTFHSIVTGNRYRCISPLVYCRSNSSLLSPLSRVYLTRTTRCFSPTRAFVEVAIRLTAPTYHARVYNASRGDLKHRFLGNYPGIHGRAHRVYSGGRSGRGESQGGVPSLYRDALVDADVQRDGGEQRRCHAFLGIVFR